MSSKQVRIMAAVSNHWLLGAVPLTDGRIQELLNDRATDFLQLLNVEVCSDAAGGSPIATLAEAVVPKARLEMVILSPGQHEAPEKRWSNLSEKESADIFAIVGDYNVRGELQLSKNPEDSLYTLTNLIGRFFPIIEASVTGPEANGLPVSVLLVNKDHVNCFHVGECGRAATSASKRPLSASADAGAEEDARLDRLFSQVALAINQK